MTSFESPAIARRTADVVRIGAPPEGLPFREAPHNLEAEQAVLGAILVNNEAHDRVSSFLESHHFYDPLHQQIYEAAAKLISDAKLADPITLRTFFENAEPIDAKLSVPQYLGKLAVNAATTINAPAYARTIIDLWARRQLIIVGEDMAKSAYDSPVDFLPTAQIDEATGRLQSLGDVADVERSNALEYAADASIEVRADDLIRDTVPAGALVTLYGPSGGGKTFVTIEMAFCIARGTPFFGRDTKKIPVLYIGLEGGTNLTLRIMAARERHGDPGAFFARMTTSVVFGRVPGANNSTAQIIRNIRQQTKAAGAPVGLVIVDTLARAMAGDNENEAAAMSAVAAQAQQITAATGATVFFVHHPGKDAEKGARGSYALFGAVDAEIVLEGETGAAQRTLRVKKLRDGADGVVGAFTLRRVVLGHDERGREITTCTVEPAEGVAPTRVRAPAPHTIPGKALNELHHLLMEGKGQPARGHSRAPANVVLIARADWQAACLAKRLGEGDAESEKRVFRRAISQLSAQGMIGEYGNDVWLINQQVSGRTNPRCPPDHKPFADHSGLVDQADTNGGRLQ